MGQCSSTIREVRFVLHDDLTHCYVAVDAEGDCPIGVQGWHHKAFAASVNVVDILTDHFRDHLLWAQEAPEDA